jgi:hypothetical protein
MIVLIYLQTKHPQAYGTIIVAFQARSILRCRNLYFLKGGQGVRLLHW